MTRRLTMFLIKIPRRLIFGFILASLTMAVGFWLKWRVLSPLDPTGWYLQSASEFAYTDLISIYLERGVAHHPLPYVEMAVEYPPVTGIVMYLASFAPGPLGYLVANYAVLSLAGLGTVLMLYLLWDRAPIWVFAATPPLALYAGLNWDLLPMFFTVASLALYERKRDGWAAAALAMGVWAKLFPALLLPAMALRRAKQGDWRSIAVMGVAFSIVSVVVNLPFAFLNYTGWRYFYDFHSSRLPDSYSIWAGIGQLPVNLVNGLAFAIVVVGLVVISVAGVRDRRTIAEQGLGILALFVLVNKVSSPQFHLWLMPFLALLPIPLWLLGFFLVADLAFYTSSFYTLYVNWGGENTISGLITAGREPIVLAQYMVLLLIFLWATLGLSRFQRRDREVESAPSSVDSC